MWTITVIFLCFGLVIYYYSKPLFIFNKVGIHQDAFPLKGSIITNYLPDFLWSVSLALSVLLSIKKKLFFYVAYLFAITLEVIQIWQTQFTFYWIDIGVISFAFILVGNLNKTT